MGELRDSFELDDLRRGAFFIETDLAIYSRRLTNEPILGSGLIVPKRHARTLFDLTADEVADIHKLLLDAKAYLEREFNPDGYTVGWNVGIVAGQTVQHAHLHVIPRFATDPQSGLGIRYWVRQQREAITAAEVD
ncbi:HIT family protein [Micromonospora sp. NPDC005553]|uniref:HIT family protein n=1 Tax=unclassified Micromonospora TaxID=2617518 RepID=UPI0033A03DD4